MFFQVSGLFYKVKQVFVCVVFLSHSWECWVFLLVSNLTHGHSRQFSLTASYSPVDYALGFVSGIYEYKAC